MIYTDFEEVALDDKRYYAEWNLIIGHFYYNCLMIFYCIILFMIE